VDKFTTLLASGLSVGAITAVVALGFLVLYKATGVVNFAHGDLMTLGAYLAMWASTSGGMPVLVAYLVALVLMAVVGAALERVAFVPLRGKSPLVVLIATLGVALIIRAAVTLWQGPRAKPLAGPVGNGIVRVAGAPISDQTILVVAVSAVAVLGCVLLFRNTPFGRQVRALAVDDEMAALCGVKVKRAGGSGGNPAGAADRIDAHLRIQRDAHGVRGRHHRRFR
jgi:branched-chain amino acid transport system permease protein